MEKVKIALFALALAVSLLFAGSLAAGAQEARGASASAGSSQVNKCDGFAIVPIGGSLDAGDYQVVLSDISSETGSNRQRAAIVSVLDANGAVVERLQVMPGKKTIYSGQNGKMEISVCQTAFGYTLSSKYAKMKVSQTGAPASTECAGYSTVEVGGTLDAGDISVALDDIGVGAGSQNVHSAIVNIVQNVPGYEKTTIAPGTSKVVLTASNQKYKVSVCQTAPGATLNSKWAKIKAEPVEQGDVEACAPANWGNGNTYGGVVDIGGEVANPAFIARLADISVGTGAQNTHPAMVDILDYNGVVLDSAVIEEGSDYAYSAQNGAKYKVYVCKTAPGYTLNAKWAFLVTGSG